MRKKHNTLNDPIFRNSKYINVLNRVTNCDFRKEYKEQYDFVLDTFSTLISLNNCFFSDSNLGIKDKIENAITICEDYIYVNIKEDEKETKKYSVRFIQKVCEKQATHLYRRINEWHEKLSNPDTNIELVLEDIEKEIDILDSVCFDNYVKEDFNYKKNKNNDYKIFISKFSELYNNKENFIKEFVNDYNDEHKDKITDEELNNICIVYNLLGKANNGVTNIIFNTETKDYNITTRSNPQEIYKMYLDTLNLKVENTLFRMDALHFVWEAMITFTNTCAKRQIDFNEMINNYEMFSFFHLMENIVLKKDFKVNDSKIENIVEELKQVYNLINNSKNTDEIINNCKKCNDIIQNRISKNQNYFIRIS